MKKLLVVLLSLGLIVALGAPASAVDLKFSGNYYVAGFYDNNPTLMDKDTYSRAAFYQQFRLSTDFVVAEGLKVTTRFDALEKQWGQTDYRGIVAVDSQGDKTNSRKYFSNTVSNLQENIEFERAYVTFATAAGQFEVGYQDADQWGTPFGNSSSTRPRVKFSTKVGPLTMLAIYEKVFEADQSNIPTYRGKVDVDADNYYLAGIYNFNGGEVGLLYKHAVNATNRALANYKTKLQALVPYFKATLGPLYLEGEAGYAFGKAAAFDNGTADVDFAQMAGYLNAKMTFGPAYFGAQVGWIQGDGDKVNEVNNTGLVNGGLEGGYGWNPTLMLNNVNTGTWEPNANSTSGMYKNNQKGYFVYGIYGGYNPTPKLSLFAAANVVAYDKTKYFANFAVRNVAQSELISSKIGTEIDLQATYKIFDNLSYMVGAAYLITGDAWKGNVGSTAEVGNNYLLINSLNLTF